MEDYFYLSTNKVCYFYFLFKDTTKLSHTLLGKSLNKIPLPRFLTFVDLTYYGLFDE